MKKYSGGVLPIFFTLILLSCSTPPTQEKSDSIIPLSASNSKPFSNMLQKTIEAINAKDFISAETNLSSLKNLANQNNEQALVKVTESLLAKAKGDFDLAISILSENENKFNQADQEIIFKKNNLLAELLMLKGRDIDAIKIQYQNTIGSPDNEKKTIIAFDALWSQLKQLDIKTLNQGIQQINDPTLKAWFELAKITNNANYSLKKQINALDYWLAANPTHPAALVPPKEIESIRIAYLSSPQKIAVILPFDGKYQPISKAIRDGLISNYYQQGNSEIHFYNADPQMDFVPIYQQAVNEGADLVIGPLLKEQLESLYQLQRLPVKTLALNQIDKPSLPNLVQFSLSADHEINSLIKFAEERNFNRVLILANKTKWGQKNKNAFATLWTQQGHTIVDQGNFNQTRELANLLKKLLKVDTSILRKNQLESTTKQDINFEAIRRRDIDFAAIFVKPNEALAIPPLFKFYYASDLPILGTSSLFKGVSDKRTNKDLNGVLITEQPFVINPPSGLPAEYKNSSLIRMFAFGKDAFAIGERIKGMDQFQNLQGATGSLTLKNSKINRHLDLALFSKGLLAKSNQQ